MCEPIYNSDNDLVILVSNDTTKEDIDKILKNLQYSGAFVIKDMNGNVLYKNDFIR